MLTDSPVAERLMKRTTDEPGKLAALASARYEHVPGAQAMHPCLSQESALDKPSQILRLSHRTKALGDA